MRLPVSFDDVAYFRKEYRGDLIITHGVIYYFPHTNLTLEKSRRHAPDPVDGVTALMGAAGEVVVLSRALYRVARGLWRALRGPTINQPRLRSSGLWSVGASSEEMQERLDRYVEAQRKEPPRLVAYELTLPKPMRFPRGEIRDLRARLGGLTFDTEFDSHDFTVGLRRGGLLREALREGDFPIRGG
jgi:hypothetical protein